MAYSVETYDSILAGILRDIRSLLPEADIGTDSDHYVRSAAVAAAIEGIYQRLAWLYRQIFPDTADEEELVHAAAVRGVPRKPDVAAGGKAALTGAAGVTLLAGSVLNHTVSGAQFVSLADCTLGGTGAGVVDVVALVKGTAQNGLEGALTLSSPPLGMDAAATFVSATTGGSDLESKESLLARLLDVIQSPPAGGAAYDFERWAKEVPGVAEALVLPRRRGGGTVDVVITGTDGVPSAEVVSNCLDYIQEQCSVIADVAVFAPTVKVVDVHATVELAGGYLLADVEVAAQVAYESLVDTLRPEQPLRRSQIEAMVSNLAGVTDRTVTVPASNVAASDDDIHVGWIRPGVVTLSLAV